MDAIKISKEQRKEIRKLILDLGITHKGVIDLAEWSGVTDDNWKGFPQRDGMYDTITGMLALLILLDIE